MPTWGDPAAAEARALGATCGGVRIWSLYVPNGRELDDPHFAYKLDWLGRLRDAAHGWLAADPQAQIALVGDWNIAPLDDDVWEMALLRGPDARDPGRAGRLRRHRRGRVHRACRARSGPPSTPTPTGTTPQLRFPKKRGMRIDFALCSPGAGRAGDRAFDRTRGAQGQGRRATTRPVVLDLA